MWLDLFAVIMLIIFWFWMIVDCARRNFESPFIKFLWLSVIVLFAIAGSLLYFFSVKFRFQRLEEKF